MRSRSCAPLAVLLIVATATAAAASVAAPRTTAAQVVETPQPFDSAGRLTRITPAAADSIGLQPPAWPVSGAFVVARLYRQSSGGYVLIVERPGGALERLPMLDESVAALRGTIDRSQRAGAAAPTAATPAVVVAADSAPAVPRAPAAASPRRPGAAPVGEVMGSQALLGGLLYGPLAATAVNALTSDPTLPYVAYLAAIGGSVLAGNRLVAAGRLTRAQNTLSTHMAVHGAAAGAALVYAAGGESRLEAGGTSLAALLGGVGGSAAGMLLGRSLDQSEAAATAFVADLTLLDGYLLVSAGSDPDRDVEVTRRAAGSLVAATAAGYALGPSFARGGGRAVTDGDVVVLAVGTGIGMLGGLAVVGDDASRRRTSYALLAGANLGVTAADLVFARRFDYKLREAGLLAAAAGAGALAMLRIPGVSDSEERDRNGDGVIDAQESNEHRALAFATAGSIGTVLLMHRALRVARDRGRPTRVGSAAPSPPARRESERGRALALTGLSVLPDAAAPGRVRVAARLAF